jgi:hypothetical protein
MNDHTLTEDRDERLGAALRELDTPEHRAEFHRELRARIAAERRPLRRRLVQLGAVAAVAAAAAIVLVAVGIPRTDRTPSVGGPQEVSAALVKSHLRKALADLRTLSGVLVASGPAQRGTERWRFALDATGDVRLEGPKPGDVITYDASAGVARSAQHSASVGADALFYAERDGVAPGPPDLGPPTWILPDEFADYVRGALASGDPGVRETTYLGRPAWRLDVDTVPNKIVPELSGDRFRIIVDRETGMPVQVVELKRGSVLRELSIEQLHVDDAVPAGTFRLDFPAGAEVMRSDDGFRRVGLDAVAGTVGYAPLVPSWVPDGYRLAEVAVARRGTPTGKEGGNPQSQMVVSLSYRRGLDQFLVTTRLRAGGDWSDPLASGEGFVDRPQTVSFDAGALQASDAELVLTPRAVPHVWALTDRLVVTVGGDLSGAELLHVSTSLR